MGTGPRPGQSKHAIVLQKRTCDLSWANEDPGWNCRKKAWLAVPDGAMARAAFVQGNADTKLVDIAPLIKSGEREHLQSRVLRFLSGIRINTRMTALIEHVLCAQLLRPQSQRTISCLILGVRGIFPGMASPSRFQPRAGPALVAAASAQVFPLHFL